MIKWFLRLFVAFIIIYYGAGVIENLTEKPKLVCHEYSDHCEEVVCPKGYAILIREEGKFLPCEHFEQYANLGNKSVLR